MKFLCQSLSLILFAVSLTWLVGCQTGPPPPATVVVVPTVPPTAPPTPWPTVNPTATSVSPTLGQWQCDPLGGLACFDDLTTLDMLNAEQGWMASASGYLFRYSRTPENNTPVWQRVYPTNTQLMTRYFYQISVVGLNEWWGVADVNLIHYNAGQVESFSENPTLFDVEIVNQDTGWVVGHGGWLLEQISGDWVRVPTPAQFDSLYKIEVISPNEAWLLGSQNTSSRLAHYQDGIWETIPVPPARSFQDLNMLDAQTGWLVGFTTRQYQNGQWQDVPTDLEEPYDRLNAVSIVSADEAWAVGDKGLMMHYQNGAWQRIDSPTDYDLLDIELISSDDGWAVGRQSTLLRLQNDQWQIVSEGLLALPNTFNDLAWIHETGEAWLVGDRDKIRHYQGGQWSEVPNPSSQVLTAIHMVTPDTGWAVGWDGVMLRYTSSSWEVVPNVVTEYIAGLDMLNEYQGLAVGRGFILRYQDGGWSEELTPLEDQLLYDVAVVSPIEAWAVGQRGLMLHYQNGVWLEVTDVTDKNLNEVTMLDAENGWAVGNDVVLRYQAGRWYAVEHPEGVKFLSMHMFSVDEGWFLSRTGAWYYHHGQWQPVTLPANNGVKLVMANEHEGWIVGGGILHYTDAP